MKVNDGNIVLETGKTVDGRDLSEDGKILDQATHDNLPNTLVKRNYDGTVDVKSSESDKLVTARNIELTGDVIGEAYFDGSSDIQIETVIHTFSHEHNSLYYQQQQVDALVADKADYDHTHSYIRTGDGLNPAEYDGSTTTTFSIDYEGTGGEYGMLSSIARADHNHGETYIEKEESDDRYIAMMDISGDNIRVRDGNGNIHDTIQAPWALTLGHTAGQSGLSLNSTDINNETNKVVRTNASGAINTDNIILNNIMTFSNEDSNGLEVDRGLNPKAQLFFDKTEQKWKAGIEGDIKNIGSVDDGSQLSNINLVNPIIYDTDTMNTTLQQIDQNYHIINNSTSGTFNFTAKDAMNDIQYVFYADPNGQTWLYNNGIPKLKTTNDGIWVDGILNGEASSAQYADLAEMYTSDQTYKKGTVLVQHINDDYELTICKESNCSSVIGVVSDKPGFLLNSKNVGVDNNVPVALTGKTPVRIIGPIKKGDPIISADDGCAKSGKGYDNLGETRIGFSQESCNKDEERLINCIIK